jgi:uncharacterized protein YkwD
MRFRTLLPCLPTRTLAFVAATAMFAALQMGLLLPLPARAAVGAQLPGAEQQLYSLTNQARAAAGLPQLAWNPTLSAIAGGAPISLCGQVVHGRSEDMLERGYFSHNVPPCGTFAWPAIRAAGIAYASAGENIAWNNQPAALSVGAVQSQFMNSPEHRANILGNYNQVGIGAYRAAGPAVINGVTYQGVVMYTVMFVQAPLAPAPQHAGGLLRAAVPAPPAPAPVLPVHVPALPVAVPVQARPSVPAAPAPVASPVAEPAPEPAAGPVYGPPAPEDGYTYANRWRVGPGIRLV